MGYEKDKDALISDLGAVGETDMFGEIRSYDGGEQKLTVFRKVGNGDKRRQVFRVSLDVVEELADFLSSIATDLVYEDDGEEGDEPEAPEDEE